MYTSRGLENPPRSRTRYVAAARQNLSLSLSRPRGLPRFYYWFKTRDKMRSLWQRRIRGTDVKTSVSGDAALANQKCNVDANGGG